jgi:hypothetical protein
LQLTVIISKVADFYILIFPLNTDLFYIHLLSI